MTRTGWPSRTTSACLVWLTVNKRAVADDGGDQQQNGDHAAGEAELHGLPPDDGVPAAGACRVRGNSVSGR